MIEWLLSPALPGSATLRPLLGRALRGEVRVCVLRPVAKGRPVYVLSPEGASARREPRWPDVLVDWAEIYEERLFPSAFAPVAGEVLSEQGEDCLALHADLGASSGARAGIAWYERGALAVLEQVGGAAVSFRPGQPLSRPSLGGARAQLASLGRRMASSERDAGLYERVEAGLAATAESLLAAALQRLLDADPPPLNELAQLVLAAPAQRLSLG